MSITIPIPARDLLGSPGPLPGVMGFLRAVREYVMGKSDPVRVPPAEQSRLLRRGRTVHLGGYQIVRTVMHGRTLFFAVRNPGDAIQSHHMRGRFYEPEELEIIRGAFRPGGIFLDIGANVGNHMLYTALFLHPQRIIVVEPNPLAYDNLIANAALNQVEHLVDFTWLGHGLGAGEAHGVPVVAEARNLGGGTLVMADAGAEGAIPVTTGDRVSAETQIDFIKIDVEGMEMEVLAGLSQTIARDCPPIFVEVDNTNRAAFLDWVAASPYRVAQNFRRYRQNDNFLLVPRAKPAKAKRADAGQDED